MKAVAPLQKTSGTSAALTTTGKATQNPLQLKTTSTRQNPLQLKKGDTTGLPDDLKASVEALSGYSMDDVQVHYNSDEPAQLQALAYAQGTDIHIAPGQEKHLPHEAWHVVQQKQGRVRPTMQMKKGVGINEDESLEAEADKMGVQALQMNFNPNFIALNQSSTVSQAGVVQMGGGKLERKKKKELEKQKLKDKQIDPNNYAASEGISSTYTSNKLGSSEEMGGHSRERHAGKDQNYLTGRNIPLATTFDSEEDQDRALEQLLKTNRDKVANWVADGYGDKRLLISGEIDEVNVSAVRKQRQVGYTSGGYEYADLTVPRFVQEDTETITHAVAVLERYLTPTKKGQTPKVNWRLITCYPSQG